MPRIVTGVKPTGSLHLGHLVGVLRPLQELAEGEDEVFCFIADYHALTSVHQRERLEEYVFSIAAGILAAGIDPRRVVFFRQSTVPAHTEFMWILTTLTPMGILERAHAYKDARAHQREVNAGVFLYPVLMAADILIYQGEVVPVGKDQVQHIEITRDIAQKLNRTYNTSFPLPHAKLREAAAALPGIDGRKMSKSYHNTIPLFGEEEEIRTAVRRIVTRSIPQGQPLPTEDDIILTLMRALDPALSEELAARYREGSVGYGEAKELLARTILRTTEPMRDRWRYLQDHRDEVWRALVAGGERARAVAEETMAMVRTRVGLTSV